MSAELYIHVLEGVTYRDLEVFQCSTLGTKFFNLSLYDEQVRRGDELYDKMSKTPQIFVGEVSWLKAMVTENEEEYVPNSVARIGELLQDVPVLTLDLLDEIREALQFENTTSYSTASTGSIIEFLQEHLGKRVFTISW